jgi:hypothetical protein
MRPTHVLAALVCCAPLVRFPIVQDDERPLAEELATLSERTDAYRTLRLRYEVESTIDGETGTTRMEIVYRAPDFGRVQVSTPTQDPSKAMDLWLVDGRAYVHSAEHGWKAARDEEPPVCGVLDERFPRADGGKSQRIGLFADVRRGKDAHGSLDLRLGRRIGKRTYLLRWLEELGSASGVEREGDSYVWKEPGVLRRISRRTGMLEELELESPKGRVHLRLESAEIDGELPRELVQLPPEARAQPEDPELTQQFTVPPRALRRLAFERADEWLTRNPRSLEARASADWHAVLVTLHRPTFVAFHAKMDADIGAKLAGAAEHLRQERAKDPSPERRAKLEEELGTSHTSLETMMAKALEKQLAALEPLDSVTHPALLEREREAFVGWWKELVAAPILARHDEELAAALER